MKTFSQVISNLNTQYDVDGPIDVSLFFTKNGKGWLYNLLKKHYQEVYKDNYRLVLYFDKDQYLYANQPGELISTLQQYVAEIDISHFFIVILSTNSNVVKDLETVRSLYSTDTVPITHIQVSDIDCKVYHTDTKEEVDTFCVKPWTHLYIGADGNVLPCCVANYRHPIGNIKDSTINNIINFDKFKDIRKQMLQNERPVECIRCYEQEDTGTESLRIVANNRDPVLSEEVYNNANTDGSIYNFVPKSMDIRINNVCNLKCRFCTGYSSSRLEAEEKITKVHGVDTYNTLTLRERDTALPEILKAVDSIESIYFAGGEPLIMEEHYAILQRLIELNKTDINIRYNTNLTKLTYKHNNVIDYWKQFSDITVGISLDASNTYAEYIRHGTKWSNIEENYNILTNDCPHVNLNITSTICLYNVFRLIEFHQEWLHSKKVTPSQLRVELLTDPDYLSIQVLPMLYKHRLDDAINNHITLLETYSDSKTAIDKWKEIQVHLFAVDNSFKLDKFFKYTDTLDTHRSENFEDVYLEFTDLRQYI